MTLLVIVGFFWGVITITRWAMDKKRERELERIKEEQRRAKQAQSEQLRKQIEQDREMLRLRREQEKERKEREAADAKLATEQEKLAKRIAQLECKVRKLDRDIQAQRELLGDYYGQLDWLTLQQSGTVPGGKEFAKYQDKIVTKQNQIRKAENKLADMTDAKERAEREMEVA